MKFKTVEREFVEKLKENLIKCFRDEETYGFLQKDKRWIELLERRI